VLAPTLLAGTGQGLAFAQLILLMTGTGAGHASDAYFYIIAWSQVPWQVVLLGMLYPAWVRGSVIPRERLWLWSVPVMSVAAVIVSAWIFAHLAGSYEELPVHAVLLACLGAVTSLVWSSSLKLAALRKTNWLAAVTLPANLVSCLFLLVMRGESQVFKVSGLLVGQILGMMVYLLLLVRARRAVSDVSSSLASHGASNVTDRGGAHRWFLGQSVVGYGSILVIQSQIAALPASSLSVTGMVSRVVSGISTASTNALLPRLVHANADSPDPVFKFVRVVNLAGWIIFACGAVAVWRLDLRSTTFGYAIFVAPWLVAANLNASLKRLAARFLEPSVATFSILSALVVPACLAVIGSLGGLSLKVVLLGLISMDLLPGVMLAAVFRQWGIMLSSLACVGLAATVATFMLS